MVWCSVCVPSVRAGGVLFKTRTQYQGVLGKKIQNKNRKFPKHPKIPKFPKTPIRIFKYVQKLRTTKNDALKTKATKASFYEKHWGSLGTQTDSLKHRRK